MFCPNCRNKVKENATFCPVCGAEIEAPVMANQQKSNHQQTQVSPEMMTTPAAPSPASVKYAKPEKTKKDPFGKIFISLLVVVCIGLAAVCGMMIYERNQNDEAVGGNAAVLDSKSNKKTDEKTDEEVISEENEKTSEENADEKTEDKSDEPQKEEKKEDTSDENKNLVEEMDATERRRINIFLSNFSEAHLGSYNSETSPAELVLFAFKHNEINYDDRIKYGEYESLDADYVDETLMRFFGKTVERKTHVNPGYPDSDFYTFKYADGVYSHTGASGILASWYTVATNMYDNGDGTYDVIFNVYVNTCDDDLYRTGDWGEAFRKERYNYDYKTAEKYSELERAGRAVVKKKVVDGYSTYELIEMW